LDGIAAQKGHSGTGSYAFVAKYTMAWYGVYEIAHTTLIVAPIAEVQTEVNLFEKWCRKGSACWKATGWGVKQPMNFTKSAAEYSFILDGIISVGKYGESDMFKTSTYKEVYPVGPVTLQEVNQALNMSRSCDKAPGGYLQDYNPGSFHATEHNDHSFVDVMLRLLNLPSFGKSRGLASSFMPENKKANPMKATSIEWVIKKMTKTNLPPYTKSKTCHGTCCGDDAIGGGIDLGIEGEELFKW